MTAGILTAAAPILITALGALLTERAGGLLIGLEGFMTLGSFGVFALTVLFSSAPLASVPLPAAFYAPAALAAVCLACAVLGLLLARFVRVSGANPFVAGLALNLAAHGFCGSMAEVLFGTAGVVRDAAFNAAPHIGIPVFESLPLIGPFFRQQSPFALAAIAASVLCGGFLRFTVAGFRLKAAGLSAEALKERGLEAAKYRALSWAAAAFLAALAGAALSYRVGVYAPGGEGGRAWIALAAVYLGFRRVWGIAAASIVLAAAEQLSFAAQSVFQSAAALPGLPSAIALLLYALACRLHPPAPSYPNSDKRPPSGAPVPSTLASDERPPAGFSPASDERPPACFSPHC
jgi:simple sugar transport system permease protein